MVLKNRFLNIFFWITVSIFGFLVVSAYPGYLLAKYLFNSHFNSWGDKLIDLEKRGLLSKSYGAGWQDVLTDQAMNSEAERITNNQKNMVSSGSEQVQVVDGVVLSDYPSLSIIDRLREVKAYSSTIEIVDRLERPMSRIKTDHQRAKINEFPPVLIKALLAAEDQNFHQNSMGIEFDSFVRAVLRAAKTTVLTLHPTTPKGTSTITQQVAKLFISRLDEQGMRMVSKSVDRKIRELRLAVALRKKYSADDILEVYLNHCVTSDYGMIGYKDIARGLFDKDLDELTDAQCVYLARMVKWGRNIKSKIVRQCKIDMDRMGDMLKWSPEKRNAVIAELDTLTFSKPKKFQGGYGSIVDLANEFWLLTLKKQGSTPEQIADMDLIDPNSLIRKKGNLRIKLSLDLFLQRELEALVNARGYGGDTTIIDEVRIGSRAVEVKATKPPKDTLRIMRILPQKVDFHEPDNSFITSLNQGDTVLENIRYKKTAKNVYRRSSFFYVRRPVKVNGQYYAYSIMDSRTGKLLAYYSRDLLGSRLACLLKNRTPNGSSTVKPILNALNYDLGIFKPYSKWSDTFEVRDDVPWKRTLKYKNGKLDGVVFDNSAVKGVGYPVHNHGSVFEGCQYIFDLLASSNNILAVETLFRLNRELFDNNYEIKPDAFQLVQLLYRTGAFARVKDSLKLKYITGVRAYKELARAVGVEVDYLNAPGNLRPVSDSMYSIALGTLEMTLYEQMHMFNCLYNNDLIEHPAKHPSLVIESITLNGNHVDLNDTIRRYHPFLDINNIRPSLLGMHKRLVSNRADGLNDYDISYTAPSIGDSEYDPEAFLIDEPLSNFAKSGTTDDVIRPFNVESSSKKKTNYGLWNAVIRIDLSKLSGQSTPDIRDITLACIGEGNTKFTGARDGKTLHKFLSTGLLKKSGIKAPAGFFTQYENYIRSVTPVTENCGQSIDSSLTTEQIQYNNLQNNIRIESLGD